MIVGLILACEALFWVLLLTGLAVRYLLRRRRLSTALLVSVPVLDVVLLAMIGGHLAAGGTADGSHGLGALYLGFTVAYGDAVIKWADVRFAHRFAGGPPPERPPKRGMPAVRREGAAWLRCVLGCAIGAAVLGGLILFVGDPERTAALMQAFPSLGTILLVHTAASLWLVAEALLGRRSGVAVGER
ncbi:hypothetical protein LP52_23145 [Streptomonospora alba]|uniref:Membrane protein YmcC n=1 Tax=Streptomonospora alba TaxID=183763 RepID=A0A0C2J5T9_9ACTN|nr:hypothetical protein [Streptomonospora alba]KIH96756.1 hypothetical protein LP52_23145 [Streptomonospora alba]